MGVINDEIYNHVVHPLLRSAHHPPNVIIFSSLRIRLKRFFYALDARDTINFAITRGKYFYRRVYRNGRSGMIFSITFTRTVFSIQRMCHLIRHLG